MRDDTTLYEAGWEADIARSEKGASFFGNMIIRTLLAASLLFAGISFGTLGYFIRPTENLLVLHYNVYFGVEIQGLWWQVFMLPVAGMLFLLGHILFARHFYTQSERVAAYLMLFGAGLLNAGISIASASIAFINY